MVATKVTYEFCRESRLLTPAHFQQVFDSPTRFSSHHFTFLVRTNKLSKPRLGFAVAKKRVKLAVNRNKIKRLTRESFRLHQHQLPSVDIIVLVKSGIDQQTNQYISQQLEKLWRKLIQRQKNS